MSIEDVKEQMNFAGKHGTPFFFILDFELKNGCFLPAPFVSHDVFFRFPNGQHPLSVEKGNQDLLFQIHPLNPDEYNRGFDIIMDCLMAGDSFLANYCRRTPISINWNLDQIYAGVQARYVTYIRNQFLSFSPETFVKINRLGVISSCPVKGTIQAPHSWDKYTLLKNPKEKAEHYTLVDLIRNDLSRVAKKVTVSGFRVVEKVKTGTTPLYQTVSTISGQLPSDFREHLGDIITTLLPAGSICGAPKKSTIEAIHRAERFPRGFYTGIAGLFDGDSLDSAVLIRCIARHDNKYYYHSGGGITINSIREQEYQEVINKIYIPK